MWHFVALEPVQMATSEDYVIVLPPDYRMNDKYLMLMMAMILSLMLVEEGIL
ncbi:MAG: hypothetical protein ACL7BU_12570 [Candidatus Phlomobacter fragariae]